MTTAYYKFYKFLTDYLNLGNGFSIDNSTWMRKEDACIFLATAQEIKLIRSYESIGLSTYIWIYVNQNNTLIKCRIDSDNRMRIWEVKIFDMRRTKRFEKL